VKNQNSNKVKGDNKTNLEMESNCKLVLLSIKALVQHFNYSENN